MHRKVVLIFFLFFSFSLNLFSHPHVWINNYIDFHFNDKKLLDNIFLSFQFDEMFTVMHKKYYKPKKDGTYNTKDILEMTKTMQKFSEVDFFVHIYLNGEKIKNLKMIDFKPKIEEDLITYDFNIVLKEPIDPFKNKINIAVYDEEYYYDIMSSRENIELENISEKECPIKVFYDKEHKAYFDMIEPFTIKLCRK